MHYLLNHKPILPREFRVSGLSESWSGWRDTEREQEAVSRLRDEMIDRKLQHYAWCRRHILSYELTMLPNGSYLRVISTVV